MVAARFSRAIWSDKQGGATMSISHKIAAFLRSRNGQRLVQRAQRFAARPENQRRLAQLRQRLAAQRHRH
jgi:hypothetical protein